MSLKQTISCIKDSKNFLITSHTNVEGDALGSELAFYRLIKALGKQVTVVNQDDPPLIYKFLPGIDKIRKFKENMTADKFDCFVLLDCADLKRCGKVSTLSRNNKPVLNIDHHISNEKFGKVNWVEPGYSSCSEMVYKLYKELGVALDKDTALLLYVGMLTDTGSFRYSNTTSTTHKIVSELLSFNLDVAGIYKKVYQNLAFQDLQLLMAILPTMRQLCKGELVWIEIKKNLLKNRIISFDLTEQILTLARTINDVEVIVLFKEVLGKKEEVRVNFRSQGKVDVNKVARFFGGGGHKTASGATVKGGLEEVKRRVLAKIKQSLK